MKKHYWFYGILTIVLFLLVFINPVHAIGYEIQRNAIQIHFWNNDNDYWIDTNNLTNITQHTNPDGSYQSWGDFQYCIEWQGTEKCAKNITLRNINYDQNTDTLRIWRDADIQIFGKQITPKIEYIIRQTGNLIIKLSIKNTGTTRIPKGANAEWSIEKTKTGGDQINDVIWIHDGNTIQYDENGNKQIYSTEYKLNSTQEQDLNNLSGIIQFRDTQSNEVLWYTFNRFRNGRSIIKIRNNPPNNQTIKTIFEIGTLEIGEEKSLEIQWKDVGCDIAWNTTEWLNTGSTAPNNADGNIIYNDMNYGQIGAISFFNNGAGCALQDPSGCPCGYSALKCILSARYPDFNSLAQRTTIFSEGGGGTACTKWADCPAGSCPIKNIMHDQNYELSADMSDSCNDCEVSIINSQFPTRYIRNIYNNEHLPSLNPEILPRLIDVQQNLICNPNYVDLDNDKPKISTQDINWLQNGTILKRVSNEDRNVLQASEVVAGLTYMCAVKECDDTNATRILGCVFPLKQSKTSQNVSLAAWPSTDVVIPETDWTNWIGIGLIFMGLVVAIVLWRKKL